MSIQVSWCCQVEYAAAWEWQKALVAELAETPEQAGQMLLLEHPPTYTLGRNGRPQNLLIDDDTLAARGIAFHHVDRGGDITYHGPGQIVGYPILNLRQIYGHAGFGFVRQYVQDLEELLIRVIAEFGVRGQRHKQHRGVWVETAVGLAKIAAIGVRIGRGGISSHGFALNVNPDLSYFEAIVPCGIQEYGVTSLAVQLDRPIGVADVLPCVTAVFHQLFQISSDLPRPESLAQVK
jgi:lipoate-protein ligase B